jgi:hypothetical protein
MKPFFRVNFLNNEIWYIILDVEWFGHGDKFEGVYFTILTEPTLIGNGFRYRISEPKTLEQEKSIQNIKVGDLLTLEMKQI